MSFVRRALRLDLLKPLDIILTRPRGSLVSTAIAVFSRGRYSHAALVVGRLVRFESVKEGVRFTAAHVTHAREQDGGFAAFEDVSRYRAITVLRHPLIDEMDTAQLQALQARVVDLAGTFNCLAYPPPAAFAAVLQSLSFPPHFVALLSRLRQPGAVDGPFCSELAAKALRQLGFEAFHADVAPNAMTPSSLARSALRPVDCIRRAAPMVRLRDWKCRRELERIIAPLRASLDSFEERKLSLRNLDDLSKEFERQANAFATSAQLRAAATESIVRSIHNVMNYETERVRNCLAHADAFFTGGARPSWDPSPKTALARATREEPPVAKLFHPIVQHLNALGVDWKALARQIP